MTETAAQFDCLLAHIERDLGFESSHYNDAYLERRISARMRRCSVEGYDEYTAVLRSDPAERAALLESFSINVTGFFRNPDIWEGFRDVLRTISQRRSCTDRFEPIDKPLRIYGRA